MVDFPHFQASELVLDELVHVVEVEVAASQVPGVDPGDVEAERSGGWYFEHHRFFLLVWLSVSLGACDYILRINSFQFLSTLQGKLIYFYALDLGARPKQTKANHHQHKSQPSISII